MPNWGEVSKHILEADNPLDALRHKYLEYMHQYTGRNVIAYYSAFIQKPGIDGTAIDENDKNAFMQTVCGLDRSKGLDLILHTQGGSLAPTESIVYYLKKMFGNNIRAIVPQIAMSAGTMIALSTKEIIMGKESNLGPIDPQYGGISCAGIIDEFETATKEVTDDPRKANVWGPIISKYHPTFIGECRNAVDWADKIATEWLEENMFSDELDKQQVVENIVNNLSSRKKTLSHSRHIHGDELKRLGVRIIDLEGMIDKPIGECNDFQDCVLTLHHTYMHTFATSNAIKIVENHNKNAMVMISGLIERGGNGHG